MSMKVIRLERQLEPGAFSVQVPGGMEILNIDDLGIVVIKPSGALQPDVTRTFEVLLPGGGFSSDDRARYTYLGNMGDMQVFELDAS